MKILDRYIGKIIIESTLLALLVLAGMQTFIGFVGELHDIGTKDYGILQALIYVPLQLPNNVYEFFPMAGLLGCLMGLGRLASHSELIVMRAAGVSMAQIMKAVLKASVLLLIIVTAIGEWLAPHVQHYAETRKSIEMSGGQALHTQQGTWIRDSDNFIHIGAVLSDGHIQDITRYQFVQHHLVLASHADSGFYQHDGRWTLQNITESKINKDHVTSQNFSEQQWNLALNPHLLDPAATDSDQQSLPKLYKIVRYLEKTDQSSAQTEFAFWQRIFQPLATLVMICLGVPFVFGPLRTVTMGFRILVGVVVGFSFYMLNEFFGPLSMVYQLPPLLAAATPAILFALVGSLLLWSMQ